MYGRLKTGFQKATYKHIHTHTHTHTLELNNHARIKRENLWRNDKLQVFSLKMFIIWEKIYLQK